MNIKPYQQYQLPEVKPETSNIIQTEGGSVLGTGEFKSPNFVTEKKGWMVDSEGNAEFQSVVVDGYAQSNKGSFGGDRSDGELNIASGMTTINLGGAQSVIKNYTSISITGTGSLAFSNPHANGTTIILKSQGNVTITSSATPCIDVRLMGASGGAGSTTNGDSSADGSGGGGGAGASANGTDGTAGGGTGGTNGADGSDGIAIAVTGKGTHGGNSLTVGTGGTTFSALTSSLLIYYKIIPLLVGAGGGGGGGAETADGGAGGRGGGALYIECGGALNYTGSINAGGEVGTAGGTLGSGGAGGGGGGGGGTVVILYNSLTANTGTTTIDAGSGGAGGAAGGGNGGNGGAGYSTIIVNNFFA